MVVPVDPHPGEAGGTLDDGEIERRALAVDVADQAVRRAGRGDQQRAARLEQLVDRLQAVPRPGLEPFAQRVVGHDGDVVVVGLVPRQVLLHFFFGIGNDGELLGRNAIAFRRVTVAPEGDTDLALLFRSKDNPAAEILCQIFLKNAAVHDLHGSGGHHTHSYSRR